MSETRYDVIGIGNALVDILVEVDDAALAQAGLPKGGMSLVERADSDSLYDTLPAGVEKSGGSWGNTMAGRFGGRRGLYRQGL